jgi:cytochrome c oxidase subunit 2
LKRRFTTANEIHVPVGRPVSLELRAQDVIHSFWVPNLAGKKDLLPGYVQSAWFRADRAGTYRGQCAEFCGAQHAKMGLVVIADPPARYEAWASQSRKPASPPVDAVQRQGEVVFLSGSCAMCHTIAGTRAGSRTGPDLTHVGSRLTLAAGTLPNTPENLARWITDPQRVKPGTRMPATQLPPRDLAALVMYLEALK